MIIPLVKVEVPHGSYDLNHDGKAEEMPARACYLHPDAALAWSSVADLIVVSDMFRGPGASAQAVASGRGAAPPGLSAHNYGRAIDIDVGRTMRRVGLGIKAELDAWMWSHGWGCWREDHAMPSWRPRPNEAWHYFWCGSAPVTYATYGETRSLVPWWGKTLAEQYPTQIPAVLERQQALRELGYYEGRADGKWGPLSQAALERFGRAWGTQSDRALAFVRWFSRRQRQLPT